MEKESRLVLWQAWFNQMWPGESNSNAQIAVAFRQNNGCISVVTTRRCRAKHFKATSSSNPLLRPLYRISRYTSAMHFHLSKIGINMCPMILIIEFDSLIRISWSHTYQKGCIWFCSDQSALAKFLLWRWCNFLGEGGQHRLSEEA